MSSTKADLPQGTLDMLILKIVALGPIHGYAIAQRLQQISKEVLQVQQGSLYPALHRLENRGWMKADWRNSETGREAKYYSLTREGTRQLETENAELEPAGRSDPVGDADGGVTTMSWITRFGNGSGWSGNSTKRSHSISNARCRT